MFFMRRKHSHKIGKSKKEGRTNAPNPVKLQQRERKAIRLALVRLKAQKLAVKRNADTVKARPVMNMDEGHTANRATVLMLPYSQTAFWLQRTQQH
jgi:hypothetical protein